jgi:pimeloyl-ACP methyl ester carboxylesterase
MTRGQGPSTTLAYRVFGAIGADRTILLLREGAQATVDPDPPATAARDVRVVAVRLTPVEVSDPGAYGGETHAEVTVGSLADLVETEVPGGEAIGLVGVAGAWDSAVLLAGELADRVDRLALVAAPKPENALARDEAEQALARVHAKTVVLSGQRDASCAAADAAWIRQHVPDARVEMVPAAAVGGVDGVLSLVDVWPRVLAHLAPGSTR